MKPETNSPDPFAGRPSLARDPSFWGMTATQFLGAFNDNLFKQVALLLCLDYTNKLGQSDIQWIATAIFAIPFVLLSGFAGFLADRFSKRRIIVLCKMAEVGIVLLGIAAFSSGSLVPVLVVLFLLGTHSAFFGPSKYGILPELVREGSLPIANGIFLMTTFAAIILGIAAAGILKHNFLTPEAGPVRIGPVAAAYLGVALTGLATAQLVRRTPVARPNLPLDASDLVISRETLRMFRRDVPLMTALAMYSLFWLIGGVVQPGVNAFGKAQLKLNDEATSYILVFLTIGIAIGCVLAGWLSAERVEFRLIRWGAWGMLAGLALLAAWGSLGLPVTPTVRGSQSLLLVTGIAVGLFTVPIQVFLQSRPPTDQKGRVIGAMNLFTWIGVLLASPVNAGLNLLVEALRGPVCWVFGAMAVLLLPVAIFYRPRETPRPESLSQ